MKVTGDAESCAIGLKFNRIDDSTQGLFLSGRFGPERILVMNRTGST